MALKSSLPSRPEDPSDAAAEAQAVEARELGTDLIREHLRGHFRQNPSSSYVVSFVTTSFGHVLAAHSFHPYPFPWCRLGLPHFIQRMLP